MKENISKFVSRQNGQDSKINLQITMNYWQMPTNLLYPSVNKYINSKLSEIPLLFSYFPKQDFASFLNYYLLFVDFPLNLNK